MPVCGPGQSDGAREARDAFDKGSANLPHTPADLASSICFGARPVIRTVRRQCVDLRLQVRDRNGLPINLNPGASSSSTPSSSSSETVRPFVVRFIARYRYNDITKVITKLCTVLDGDEGYVTLSLNANDLNRAGIFIAELDVRSEDSQTAGLYQASPYWLVVEPTVNDRLDTGAGSGPITISEIRLLLRDECPAQNFLLDDFEFDDSQIVFAMTQPIEEFNETNMPRTHYVVRNFPYKFHWRRAVVGYLLEIASRGYMRNHLDYQAGDVAVQDKRKFEAYALAAEALLKDWRRWMVQEKMNINVSQGYGTLRSGYSRVRRI